MYTKYFIKMYTKLDNGLYNNNYYNFDTIIFKLRFFI